MNQRLECEAVAVSAASHFFEVVQRQSCAGGWLRLFLLSIVMGIFVGVGCGPPPIVGESSTEQLGDGGGTTEQMKSGDGGGATDKVNPLTDRDRPEVRQTCQSACDCPQGLHCGGGQCLSGTKPVYCCEKADCPPGKACVSRRGGNGTCGSIGSSCKSACDCLPGIGCINGQCTKLGVPIYCCERPQECPAKAKCETKTGKEEICGGTPGCQTHCDCPQGQSCLHGRCTSSAPKIYCCTKPDCPKGEACFFPTGKPDTCGVQSKCRDDADCGKRSCRIQGNFCFQTYFICSQGSCKERQLTISNARCTDSGICLKNSSCQAHCDCLRGQMCVNGRCVAMPGQSVWCCSDPLCPSGAACYRSDNSKSTCRGGGGCKSDADCPAQTCHDAGSDCFETQYACDRATGKCVSSRFHFRNSTCEQASGRCQALGPPCKVNCDCPQGQVCAGGHCRASTTSPAYCCTKAGCPAGKACTDASGKSGTCGSASCTKNSDCGKPYCVQQGRDCTSKAPACKAGVCSESSISFKNMICDVQTGQCNAGCFGDADCKKPSCTQNGKFCVRTVYTCRAGKCQAATSSDVGTCDTATGVCKPAASCQSHCDCAQGYFCYQGKCARSSYPVYCCQNPGCPSGAPCYGTTSNLPQRCPVLCSSACDCPEGQACVKGKCVKGQTPVYCCERPAQCPPGQACTDRGNKVSTCPQRPRPCQTACDCVQGEACVNGQCAKSSKPVYCCEKDGCPLGQGCISQKQLSGTCPKTCNGHCDCPQGFNCIQGRCTNDPALSGPVFCCTNPKCPAGQVCYHPNGRAARCPAQACKSPCDCNQGEDCINGQCTQTRPPVYCCTKGGCPSGAACRDAANQWSTCQSTTSCKTACDCNQGQDCFRGQCVGVHPPVYCCNKTGCPSGMACYDKNNQRGFCPTTTCQTACDCPVQGQSCVRNRCVYLTQGARIYCCNKPYCPAGRSCEDSQGNLKLCSKTSCKSPCDCRLGEDCRNNVCVNVNPPVYCCSASICPRGQSCVKADGSRSTCP